MYLTTLNFRNMKTKIKKATDFYCGLFSSKLLENAGLILAVVGFTYWIIECIISIVQKWNIN